ncbi:hypothetical protein LTR70_005690 [Exophiala xenobiotica]|uniref:Uncharacterized protein n=1 Tax=Lithohypha guttulata TaxID=1690604 RepID=A0ABR0KF01_9EURO|nr:hypothetical protein LTR24_004073 [Lithohypha guttulata]KAK5317685.1 hypothetical protein LTR70_005690 [Exophiala xenobiotica]
MTFWPSSKWVWAFILVSVAQAAAVLALEIYIFVGFTTDIIDENAGKKKTDPATTIPTFLTLYIFAFVYQLVLVWDALRMKNTIQILGLVGLNIGLLIYGAVQVEQLHEAVDQLQRNHAIELDTWSTTHPLLIAIPCILAFFTIIMAFCAYKLYNEFAWTIYKHISADLRMKRRYLTYQIYIALLKFDFFFCLGFTIQFVVIVGGKNNIERYATAAAIPATIIIMFAAFWFTRRENLVGTIVVIALYFGGLGYFCFKLVRMYQPEKKEAYIAARKELTTFAVLTIGLLISTIIVACMCAHSYGKGLKPYVTSSAQKKAADPNSRPYFGEYHGRANSYPSASSYPMHNEPYNPKQGGGRLAATRMEID